MISRIFRLYPGLIIIFIFLLTGCASHRPETNPVLDKKAFSLSFQAASRNQNILSSRGIGQAVLQTPEKTDKFKIVWATIYPDNIRMTFLASGLPIETILMSKETITFLSHTGQHAKYTYHSKDPDMERFVQVPVKMSEIIQIFLGRVPIKNFNDAYFTDENIADSSIALITNQNNQTQYLTFGPDQMVKTLTTTDLLGDVVYKLAIKKHQIFDDRKIPVQIEITDRYHRKLTLDITDFITNPDIKEGVFQLTGS